MEKMFCATSLPDYQLNFPTFIYNLENKINNYYNSIQMNNYLFYIVLQLKNQLVLS